MVDFDTFVHVETGKNTVHGSNKIYHFTLTVSPHYLVKPKRHKTAYLFIYLFII